MHGILVVMFLFISSAVGMSRATATRNFNQCFPGWAKADQVTVSCNDIKIAQYCDSGHQSCRTMNKPGVSLEKGSKGVCLNITNCSYDSRSCEALSYIDHEQQGTNNFTVDVCNQTPSTSYSTGNNESQSDTIAAGVTAPVIGLLIIFFILYQKVKCFRKAIRGFFSHPQRNKENPTQEPDIEKGENKSLIRMKV